jgi:DNA-binding protein HU-beta
MYKTELVRRVAKDTRLSQRIVSDVVAATLREMTLSLSKDGEVVFPGFGTFYTRMRPPSQARSFKTGKTVEVPEMRVAGFRAGLLLKKAVRRSR